MLLMRDGLLRVRHEITGRARYWGVHAFTRIFSHDQLVQIGQRLRARDLSRACLERAGEWYGRAPIGIETGPAAGLFVSSAHLPLDHAHVGAIIRGGLEPSVAQAMLRAVRPGAVFYDIGANVGYFTLVAARMVGAQGRVIAFDPVPWCSSAIAANIALNDLHHAEVREVAVGDHAGRARLQVVKEAGWSRLTDIGAHRDTREEIEVEMVTIDDLVRCGAIPPPDVVKIDTEGAEVRVLEGMRETLANHGPRIICELHGTNAAFSALMDDVGYQAGDLDGPLPVAQSAPDIHVFAQPHSPVPAARHTA